ncbi:uncharacterized protein BKA78DRAFT_321050 [Phyllosticta capitalensis]|uniref:uncharacterized protein n=1 Tax=Phyllosticta capitalensis TaxID=121624 RepID=UPI0031328795
MHVRRGRQVLVSVKSGYDSPPCICLGLARSASFEKKRENFRCSPNEWPGSGKMQSVWLMCRGQLGHTRQSGACVLMPDAVVGCLFLMTAWLEMFLLLFHPSYQIDLDANSSRTHNERRGVSKWRLGSWGQELHRPWFLVWRSTARCVCSISTVAWVVDSGLPPYRQRRVDRVERICSRK